MEGKAEKMLKDFGKKIDKFLSELKGSSGNMKEEFDKRYEELKKSAGSLENEAKAFKDKHQDKLDDIEAGIEKAGKEIREAFKDTFGKKGAKKKEK